MKVGILGDGLTSLALAKMLVNKCIYVDLLSEDKAINYSQSRTFGITKKNFDFFTHKILDIKKISWKLSNIEIYTENLLNQKIEWHNDKSISVVLCSKGYPEKFENNIEHSLIISENADIINKGDQIILKDNVTLTRFPTKTRKQLKLFTSELNIFPNDDYVSSSQPIKIVQEPNIEINGVGMIYNKTENTFKILKKVTVYYEKPKK